jgi:hypothetical protein
MQRRLSLVFSIILVFTLASCQNSPQVIPTAQPKVPTEAITPEVTYVIVTNTPEAVLPTATSAALPTATTAAAATSSPSGLPDYSSAAYLDDRSTAASLILSFTNAINRHEYLRAYSYWPDAADLGTLDGFTSSMTNVTNETVALGQVTSEGAAGSVYFTVPAAVTDSLSGGGTTKYGVCYTLRFPQPGNYGAPPIQPLHFNGYTKAVVDASVSDANVISAACTSVAGLPSAAAAVENLGDISSTNYIDNRSGAVEVVKSLLNAINRKEYVRAYSYFENPVPVIGTYTAYANGFNDTSAVTSVVFGTVLSDAGAGQYHYQVPLAEYVTHTNSTTHLYVGCYTLHLANPGMQGALPFRALSITTGKLKEYPTGTDVAPLFANACK